MVIGYWFEVQRLQLLETANYNDQDPEYGGVHRSFIRAGWEFFNPER